jgi:carbon storage regulator
MRSFAIGLRFAILARRPISDYLEIDGCAKKRKFPLQDTLTCDEKDDSIRMYKNGKWLYLRRMNAMLVLSRKSGEKIHIGSGITVTVIEVRGNQIRLGIDAPEDVPIFRAELCDRLVKTGNEPANQEMFGVL